MESSHPRKQKQNKAAIPLLLRLSEACNKHKSLHCNNTNTNKNTDGNINDDNTDHDGDYTNGEYDYAVLSLAELTGRIPERCHKNLKSLKTVLPKVEEEYQADVLFSTNNSNNNNTGWKDASHLCSFYESILSKGFCPHALCLFDYGKGGTLIFPRVMHLLQYLLVHPNNKNNEHDTVVRIRHQIQGAFGDLLGSIPEPGVRDRVWTDLCLLLEDLNYVESNHSILINDGPGPVQVQMFATASPSKEYFLDISTLESLHTVQSTTFTVLGALFQKVGCENPHQLKHYHNHITSSVIPSIEAAILNNFSTSSDHISCKLNAVRLLQTIMQLSDGTHSTTSLLSSLPLLSIRPIISRSVCKAV